MAENRSDDSLHHSVTAPEHGTGHERTGSHGISINLPPGAEETRPPPIKHTSSPSYKSPIRHHQRTPSRGRGVKETLNARSHYGSGDDGDGPSVHRINQYIIKQEIGRGSFGSVHLAEDQYGKEYAVKEFSKSRLRKRAQSNLLRKPNQGRRPGQIAAGLGFNSPLHRLSSSEQTSADANNSLSLIKEEIAIMKKLDHNNLVSLIEVLDDPQEDSLYMVLEMCKKGVAMKVGLEERAEPYDDETCRCWFRDMILGIEYLHAQGIVHRDIKPDNCLITEDDVLKIVDFGVSEMFEKQSEMTTAKSAGSPAFMPPELCVARHGQVSGRAADIWSMGVTLYCMRYGHIPFEKGSMLELYDSIRADPIPLNEESDPNFADIMKRLLEKDPESRITMDEIRNHPWVTKNGTDTLLSAEENCADLVEPPTEIEKNHAITDNMGHVLAVVGAAKRFKTLLHNKRGRFMEGLGIFGQNSRFVTPPQSMGNQATGQVTDNVKPMGEPPFTEGKEGPADVDDGPETLPQDFNKMAVQQGDEPLRFQRSNSERGPEETEARYKQRMEAMRHHPSFNEEPQERENSLKKSKTFPLEEHAKGQAHDPLEDRYFLHIGPNADESHEHADFDNPVVSESPGAVEWNIYEQAYQEEMERITARRGRQPSMYMTRRVEHREDIRALSSIKDAGKYAARKAQATFDDLYAKGYTAGAAYGEAGRSAARATAGRMHNRYWPDEPPTASEGVESVRTFARNAASEGYKNATDVLGGFYNTYSKSGTKRQGLSNLVSQAQSKARGDAGVDIVASPTDIGTSPSPARDTAEKAEPVQPESSTNTSTAATNTLLPSLLGKNNTS